MNRHITVLRRNVLLVFVKTSAGVNSGWEKLGRWVKRLAFLNPCFFFEMKQDCSIIRRRLQDWVKYCAPIVENIGLSHFLMAVFVYLGVGERIYLDTEKLNYCRQICESGSGKKINNCSHVNNLKSTCFPKSPIVQTHSTGKHFTRNFYNNAHTF